MLVLTRKSGERILIGDNIAITVVEIGKSRVKVGIEAPVGHRILRSELVLDRQPGPSDAGAEDGREMASAFRFAGGRLAGAAFGV